MLVFATETSCDETGVAVYDSERGLLTHVLYSQVAVHAEYGGVVPELASRDHVRKLLPLIRQVMAESNLSPREPIQMRQSSIPIPTNAHLNDARTPRDQGKTTQGHYPPLRAIKEKPRSAPAKFDFQANPRPPKNPTKATRSDHENFREQVVGKSSKIEERKLAPWSIMVFI